ncbi:MAG: co-chaperone GroES [Bacteroidales bacterium]|nr:co-chaperone GroES [Bacteroidales bacterium]
MKLSLNKEDLDQIIMVGDRVLIKPKTPQDRTKSGLYLPASIEQKEKLHNGYVVKVGPGYPIPAINDFDEPWRDNTENVKFVPIQPQIGDLAVYLQSNSFEIAFNKETFVIVPSSAILMLVRDDGLIE